MYNYLIRRGYAPKYQHAGIYSISINDHIIYIGKSYNMLRRVAQHYVGIRQCSEHKYKVIHDLQQHGYRVSFDVLCYAQSKRDYGITEEIGEAEGRYIRQYMPPLNTQIPKETNWREFTVSKKAQTITAEELLEFVSE